MNKIKSILINYTIIISFLLCSAPSFSMMTCNGNGFEYDEYRNGTISCRSTNLTCSYKPEDQWSWASSGFTYAFASAVFNVALDRALKWEWPLRIWNKCKKCCNTTFCKTFDNTVEDLAGLELEEFGDDIVKDKDYGSILLEK